MSQFTFFSNMHWRNLALNFPQNDLHSLPPSSWTVTQKISEDSDTYTQEEAREMEQFPLASAKFECENVEDSSNKATLLVDMEIPCVDTECPAEGTYGTPNCVRVGLEAHKLLSLHDCKYSPGLIQYMEETQTSGDPRFFMPGGKIYYMVIDKLPGVPLGTGLLNWTEDGRTFGEGLFWELSREERDRIRAAFEVAYIEHIRSKVTIAFETLSKIFWDNESGKVQVLPSYFQGGFEPLDLRDIAPRLYTELDDYGPKVLRVWGLAIAPKGNVDYDVPMDNLEQLGWIL